MNNKTQHVTISTDHKYRLTQHGQQNPSTCFAWHLMTQQQWKHPEKRLVTNTSSGEKGKHAGHADETRWRDIIREQKLGVKNSIGGKWLAPTATQEIRWARARTPSSRTGAAVSTTTVTSAVYYSHSVFYIVMWLWGTMWGSMQRGRSQTFEQRNTFMTKSLPKSLMISNNTWQAKTHRTPFVHR